ncbi:MAG: class I SAM-dependent methyltransferase [Pseudomonadota bacterium]
MTDAPNLKAAYMLQTPDDSKRLYARWATSYDSDFAAAKDFRMPRDVADIFRARGGEGPVLDAGAGTGLVAAAICAGGACVVDAFDISAEMLAVAEKKAVYRTLVQGDLSQRLPFEDGSYAAVVSAGTFTHGHVGPDALPELLRVARPAALFVLTIKKTYFDEGGFAAALEGFGAAITGFETVLRPIYGTGPEAERDKAEGLITSFRKA